MAKTSIVRPIANFPPSLWGDRFLSFDVDNLELDDYLAAMKEPSDEMQRLIVDPGMDTNEKLRLINCVGRLGLSYLFIKDIECELEKLFKELDMEEYNQFDLYTTSVNFLVFRQYGYKLSCDVFNKFKDVSTGKFKEHMKTDVKGMLCLYECTHLGIRGESILDEALAFTESHLKAIVETLEGTLAQQVKQGLKFPCQRGLPIVEARLYFSNFEEECSIYDALPKLAKAHFSYFQLIQKDELSRLTKWSKDMKFQTIATYTRDKMPELYLWVLAVFLEPRHVEARIITTKIAQLVLVLDDTFDAYATIEELRLLTDAISRWEVGSVEQLPEFIKPFYQILLNEYAEWEKELAKEGRENVVYASKKAFQELARAYLREAEWRHSGTVPSFQEYYENGLVTSTYNLLAKSSLVGMGKIVDEEALAWYESHQKILEASELIARLHNDVVSFEFEREREHRATGIDAYMKTFGVTEDVAVKELKEMIENAWKDINEGCLKPTKVSMELLAPIVNLSRVIYVAYRFNDGFTFSDMTLKDYITLLFEASVPV
uniref:germacrene A synthase short form-like n=1 Tax=Erigeron canadensis TaxID=72917 RepID=UPI001CB9066C|nr:germacrene A synthase short form-like [Erigeron canadensis]